MRPFVNALAGKDRVPTDRHNSPQAGTGAGGTNYMQGSGYDTGTAVKGYIANQQLMNTGEGYLTTPAGEGPGFGIENEGSGHNTGIGATGAGTGTSGYHHGQGDCLCHFARLCLF